MRFRTHTFTLCVCVCVLRALVVEHLNYPQLSARDNQIARNLTKTTHGADTAAGSGSGSENHNTKWQAKAFSPFSQLSLKCQHKSTDSLSSYCCCCCVLAPASSLRLRLRLLRAAWRKCWWIFLICCVRSLSLSWRRDAAAGRVGRDGTVLQFC